MPTQAENWFQEQWNSAVIHVYQQKGYLTKGMSVGPSKIEGKKLYFNIAGKAEAQDYVPRSEVKVMNATRGTVSIDASEWDAADYIYQYDLDRMPVDEVDTVRETAAMALGRKHDLVLYEKLQATDFNTPGQVSGAFNAAFGLEAFMSARRKLFERDVPVEDGMNFCGMPPIVFDTMMSYKQFSSADYVGPNLPFIDGMRRKTFQNVHIFELPIYLQKKSSTDGTFYMWHKSALGTGYTGEPLRTGFEWQLSFKRWYYQSTISGGSTIIQSAGIEECRYKTDTGPTFS